MATDCTQEAVLDFVKERGGRVKNADLIEHFKTVFPEEPEEKAAVRERFKNYVDNVAFVKTESGVKYVCLKKSFRFGGLNEEKKKISHHPAVSQVSDTQVRKTQPRAAAVTEEPTAPGNDSQVTAPREFTPAPLFHNDGSNCHEFVYVVEKVDDKRTEMGNSESFWKEKRDSKKKQAGKAPDIPEISVIHVSPLPAFTLPGSVQTGSTGQVDTTTAGLGLANIIVETERGLKEEERVRFRCGSVKGSQGGFLSTEGNGEFDTCNGGEGSSSPKGSRQHFIQVMMDSSPQVRRSIVLRNSVYFSSRNDSDSASLFSSTLDEDRAPVTLEPLEHEWMMCASDGEWDSLCRLLTTEPSLILRKDFITGFTCLHWAAKHGKPEVMALILKSAKQHDVPISVDVRSSAGYTPLHIAAMHNHMEVVKLLVGAFNADVEIRDYSGRKACQYLTDNVSMDIRDIIGAYEQAESENADHRNGRRWRFSKVLQSNLKPLKPRNPSECDSVDGDDRPQEKPLRRRPSLSRLKPKLQSLRLRTSQIIHSRSFREMEDLEGSRRGSFKSRPKTHFFGNQGHLENHW
ncbi:ankyrin repeat domain-containing protein SOWAHC-like [Mastacembelus armatus]|uniref:ankyrin repeat domain-containing protein SOWAHC-like n=1 Tax=Mastacembelus armatus TaxID=205130 RepID=UPI000E455387|nr:ankyrin repeat domain-containing protein SOWAHC-like [Mastacembelus armatus]